MADGTKFSGSLLAGLVLLPVSAIAAVALTGVLSSSPATGVPDAGGVAAAASPVLLEPAAAPVLEPGVAEADIFQACGPDAATLVAKEANESITALEDAALDALRSVCEQEGIPVDGPLAPAPVFETVVVPLDQGAVVAAAAPAPAPTNGAVSHDDDSESGEYPDDDDRSDDDRSDDDDSD